MANLCDLKLNMVEMVANDKTMTVSEEDTLTQTPRSQFPSGDGTTYGDQSPNSSSAPGSRSGSKSEVSDDEDYEDDEGQDTYHEEDHDEYYDFLREMAGSFEATREESEDDESEVGSDSEGSSDEDEDGQAVGRKRSSSLSADDIPDNGLLASPQFVDHGQAHRTGNPKEECMKASASVAGRCAPVQPTMGGYPANKTAGLCGPRQGHQWPSPAPNSVSPIGADMDVPRKRVVISTLCRATLDTRPPVVDDYDVVKATAEYAAQRAPLSRFERQREELLEAIQLRTDQAAKLLAPARKQKLDPELRSHYVHIRSELLKEARALEEQLKVLVEAQQQSSCSQAEAALVGHQETPFGAHGVVVQ